MRKMEGKKMSPADGATLPSSGGTRREKYSVPPFRCCEPLLVRYSVQEDCRPVRAIPLGFGSGVDHYPTYSITLSSLATSTGSGMFIVLRWSACICIRTISHACKFQNAGHGGVVISSSPSACLRRENSPIQGSQDQLDL